MPQVGIRQLKLEASEIIRAIREEGAEYIVTHRGQAVAVILPVAEADTQAGVPSAEIMAALASMRARIAADRRTDRSALEILEALRRD